MQDDGLETLIGTVENHIVSCKDEEARELLHAATKTTGVLGVDEQLHQSSQTVVRTSADSRRQHQCQWKHLGR